MYYSELSLEAQNIVCSVQNTYQIFMRIQSLINSLAKKIKKGIELSQKQLEESSVLDKICGLGVKELKKTYCELKINSEHRKEFKKYYAEHIISEAESLACNL